VKLFKYLTVVIIDCQRQLVICAIMACVNVLLKIYCLNDIAGRILMT